jgi:sulfate permease, SulP family
LLELASDLPNAGDTVEPFDTLVKAFASYGGIDRNEFQPLFPYLERVTVPEGLVLWKQGDDSDGLYIIESGVLRASYLFADYSPTTEESMVPGTLAGELSALSGMPRNSTVVVERQAVLWKLTTESLRHLEVESPDLARTFIQLVLKCKILISRPAHHLTFACSREDRL